MAQRRYGWRRAHPWPGEQKPFFASLVLNTFCCCSLFITRVSYLALASFSQNESTWIHFIPTELERLSFGGTKKATRQTMTITVL
ncbi:hypothetical protein VTI74DRAFT_6803 [Chaetomium olivicolor]